MPKVTSKPGIGHTEKNSYPSAGKSGTKVKIIPGPAKGNRGIVNPTKSGGIFRPTKSN